MTDRQVSNDSFSMPAYTSENKAMSQKLGTEGADNVAKDSGGPMDASYGWQKADKRRCCLFVPFILSVVLAAAIGSFMFGYNVSLLNTSLKVIHSEFETCGVQDAESLGFASMTPEECLADSRCAEYCVVTAPSDGGAMTKRCPGGPNDLECDSLKWYDALITCALLVGGAVAAMLTGKLLPSGRRLLLLVTMGLFFFGSICCITSVGIAGLVWGRFVVGLGIGFTSVASPTYIAEATPPESRGKYSVMHQVMVTVGILIPMVLGLAFTDPREQDDSWVLGTFDKFWWRFMIGIGLIPVVIALYLFMIVFGFETPVWYVEKNRVGDALEFVRRVHGKDDVTAEVDVIVCQVNRGKEMKELGLPLGKVVRNPNYRMALMVGIFLAVFQQFGGINVFMTSSSTLFKQAGLSSNMQTVMSIIMAVINVVMTFPTILLVERMGRKPILFWGSVLQVVFLLPAAVAYWITEDPAEPTEAVRILAIVAILGFVFAFAVGFGPIVWVYLFEMFPAEIKDVASSLATALNWAACVVMVFVALVVGNRISFTLFAVLQLGATVFIAFCMKETKGLPLGKSPYMVVDDKKAIV